MNKISCALSLLAGAILLSSCTKDKEVPKAADGKLLVSRQGTPERVVFETELVVPKEYASRVKRTDLMIWDLKTNSGDTVSAHIVPVPEFPAKLVVLAKELLQPIPEEAHLLFSARIVRFGDEGKPPVKGQLTVFVGAEADDRAQVDTQAASRKAVDKYLRKQKHSPIARIDEFSVGEKVDRAEFAPSLM